jgi:circadian clock protein KaiC
MMETVTSSSVAGLTALAKAPTGIAGLDEVTEGGLPRGRPTLVCGPAGSGKTLLAMEFLVRGITQFGESGVFMAFEETRDDLVANVASLDFDLTQFEADGKLVLDHVNVVAGQMVETGDWDLEGLFIRLGASIDAVGADRVVIDTIETLFGAFKDAATLRSELRRLFLWLKARGVTAVITGERGNGMMTRHGIEEYVSDCVIVLDHLVAEQTSTRRLRVLKYRGSLHGTNEYPFLIGSTASRCSRSHRWAFSTECPASGLDGRSRLDAMLGGAGRIVAARCWSAGPRARVSPRSPRSSAMPRVNAVERAIYFAFEESQDQIIRNMESVGMGLARWVEQGMLRFRCVRPSLLGLEAHLSAMQELVEDFDPAVVVLDPISDLVGVGTAVTCRRC